MKRKKIKLNVKFAKDKVVCAKSPIECKLCRNISTCELMELYYYPYDGADDCMKHRSYKRERGAIRQNRYE